MYKQLFGSDPPKCASLYSDAELVRVAVIKKKLGDRKVVVNMTSIPPRFVHLQQVVNNLKTHLVIDKIVIHIPKKYTVKTFEYSDPPELNGAEVNLVDEDYGPCRRYIYGSGGQDINISLDDDTWYDHHISIKLIEKYLNTGDCWTGSGFNFNKYFLGDFSKIPNESVQIMEGYGMILIPGDAIDKIREEFKELSHYNTSDDLILNNLLEKHGYKRNFYSEDGWIKQLDYGFNADALHKQNAEGSHLENYKKVLKDLKRTGKLFFKPIISYAICVCNEHVELRNLLDTLVNNMIHSDEIRVLVDKNKVTNEVIKVLDDYNSFITEVHMREFNGDFSEHKNFLNSKCNGKYIFNLDADEVPSGSLIENVYRLTNSEAELVYVPRVNIVLGASDRDMNYHNFTRNEVGFINWPDFQGRIYANAPHIKWESNLHERIAGAKKVVNVSPEPNLAIWHVKSVEKCRQQKDYYDKLV